MRFPRMPPGPWARSWADRHSGPAAPPGSGPDLPNHERPGFPFSLRDGRLVYLSPVLPGDRRRLEAGYEQLSDRSKFFRFFRDHDRLTEAEIRLLTEVDQVNHVAWCALDLPDPPFDGLGIGRMIRDVAEPASAEVAVTVIDALQRHGLGSVLLAVLVLRARSLGIDRLRAFVLPENDVVVRWLEQLGWSVLRDREYFEFETPTDPGPPPPGASPTRERFERLLADLRGPLGRCLAAIEGRTEAGPIDPAESGTASGPADTPGRGDGSDDRPA